MTCFRQKARKRPGVHSTSLRGQVAFALDQHSQFWNQFQARGIA